MLQPSTQDNNYALDWLSAELLSVVAAIGGCLIGAIYGTARARKVPLLKVTGWGLIGFFVGGIGHAAFLYFRWRNIPSFAGTIHDVMAMSLYTGAPIGLVIGAICAVTSHHPLSERSTTRRGT
jgi:hypothetical protein